MSDHKPHTNKNPEDMQALFELLNRLERREEVRRYQENLIAFNQSEPMDLITMEEPKEKKRPEPARFQPTGATEIDTRDLLLTDNEAPLEMKEYRLTAADLAEEDEDEDEEVSEKPVIRRNPFKALWKGFCGNFPRKGDTVGTKVRKCGFLFSLLVMLVAIVYLVVDLMIIPVKNNQLKNELIGIYHPEQSQVVVSVDNKKYPTNMLASFQELYDRNNEVRGWISYHADGKKDFLDIEYPIVYSGDNEKYLKKDFDGNKNRNGTLFFDQSNRLNRYDDQNRSLIVYGHNMASGQMFAGLNKFLGSVNNARAAATLTMSTLYRQDQYLVFAVILTDEDDNVKGRYFNTRRTSFTNDTDFLAYIDEMRARSLFDYPVEVQGNDQILVLSTCTGRSSKLDNGRLVVVARRVRDGETAAVNTSAIVKNEDVIMPYYWYINQDEDPHSYYVEAGLDYPEVPNAPNGSTMNTGYSEATTTTAVEGETGTTDTTGTASDGTTTVGRPTTGTTAPDTPTAGTTTPTKTTAPTTGGTAADTTAPVESTGATESTAPTEPSVPTESTAPSAEPTEPSSEPTEPSAEPTEPSAEPSAEPTEPTTPATEPTGAE